MITVKELKPITAVLNTISNDIAWDNWEHTDKDGEPTGKNWSVLQVLYSKTAYVLENLKQRPDDSEAISTVEELQKVIEALQKIKVLNRISA